MTLGAGEGRERRRAVFGLVLLALAGPAWITIYGPPGTMTSIALAAMAAVALATAGVVLLVALVLHLRR